MSVHEDITRHSKQQHEHLARFEELDAERERLIEEAVARASSGLPYTTEGINRVTRQIIEHAKHGISPLRVLVTNDMVQEYAEKMRRES